MTIPDGLPVFLSLEDIADICVRADLQEYGAHNALIKRLAFELGIVHASLHLATERLRAKNPEEGER